MRTTQAATLPGHSARNAVTISTDATRFLECRASSAQHQLLESSPDSAIWQQEAEQYHINTILLSIARYDGLGFCPTQGLLR